MKYPSATDIYEIVYTAYKLTHATGTFQYIL